jgi:uncharacterized repeat protein (TIGR03833 family)
MIRIVSFSGSSGRKYNYNCTLILLCESLATDLSNLITMDGTRRADIIPGITVMVELAEDKRTGRLTGGKVKEVLTTSPNHPHGIKVKLENGLVGRIKKII